MKDIKEYEGLYAITKDGKVWSYPKILKGGKSMRSIKGRFIKPWLIGRGYEMIMIYKDEIPKKFLVHRLVAMAYIPNPHNLKEVNHKNAKITDNRVENLEWVTSKENKQHAIKLGLYDNNRGSKCHLAKLNEEKVKRVKGMLKDGVPQTRIARFFGVSQMVISDIKRGICWKDVV